MTFEDLLAEFGGSKGLFKAMNGANPGHWFSHQRLYTWRKTRKFPRTEFDAVIKAAEYANIEGVTLEALFEMAAKRSGNRNTGGEK